ncbi:MAG: TonB-dependent receptor [Woeseiaceae bacterium]|nr:TonB-dependent receptor [Woeseiaceae bacterium]
MNKHKFSASALATAIVTALVTVSPTAVAQDDETIDEIVVRGIRGSLTDAMDIKRNSDGVVDAISAEDIGKFPDANLAESLQRITGVSIDRAGNEGNQITVRGLGPNFNMVTLNGRQMPAASSPEQESISSATQSRAFNFNQIASESVSGVNVYKTARPDVTPGGIGATVDIRTARPFDFRETTIFANVRAIHDTSVEKGDDFTPEFGGLFSTLLADERVGLLANFSYSKRDYSEPSSHTDGWLRDDAGSGSYAAWCSNYDCTGVPYIYRSVSNIGEIQHNERKRLNGQLVAQFAPNDNVEITLDYVMSDFDLDQDRFITGLFGVVEGNTVTDVELDENFSVTRAIRSNGAATIAADVLAYQNTTKVENESIGFNIEWQVNDSLMLTFDAHDSEAISQPNGELNDRNYIIQGPLGAFFDLTYDGAGVYIDVDDSGVFRGTCQFGINDPGGFGFVGEIDAPTFGCGNIPGVDGFQDPDGFSGLGSVFKTIGIDNTVEQFQLDATWSFDETELTAGVAYTDYGVETLATNTGFVFQGLYPCAECDVHISEPVPTGAPSGFQTTNEVDLDGFLNAQRGPFLGQDFSNLGFAQGLVPAGGNWPNPDQLLIDSFPPTFFGASEKSTAVYINLTNDFELGNMPARISAGLRYESTDVEGSAFQNFPTALQITTSTEGQVIQGPEQTFFTIEGDYSVFLPALDFRLEPREDHVLRFSYGRSIARPDLNGLRPTTTVSDYRPGTATASSGNPDLNPYLSDNFDLSWEWYYSEGSYLSVAYFFKQIDDYIGTDVVQDVILDANGEPLRNPEARFDPSVIPNVPVISEPTDPVAIFDVTRLINGEEREVDGLELAVQHLFGDTGFGLQANYTVVDSDAEFDLNKFDSQAILIGLSDSWNLVGFFENELFSVRVAANWRDKFLFATNQLRATNEPVFFDEYLQVDLSAAWYMTDNLTLDFEVLNATGEDQLQSGRYRNQFLFENDQDPRYTLGLRARF